MSAGQGASGNDASRVVPPWPDFFPRYTRLALPLAAALALLGDLGLCTLYVLNELVGAPVDRLSDFIALNGEGNLPAWYSSVQWFAVALLLAVFVYRRTTRDRRTWVLWAIPAVVMLFSLDESVRIHEFVGMSTDALVMGSERGETALSVTGSWIIVMGIPFIVGAAIALLYMRRFFAGYERALTIIVIGLVVMLMGALGIETLSNFIGDAAEHWPRVLAEEAFELFGASIMLWGAYDLAFGAGRPDGAVATVTEASDQGA